MSSGPLDLRLAPAALTAWILTAVGVGWPAGRALLGAAVLLLVGVAMAVLNRRFSQRAHTGVRTGRAVSRSTMRVLAAASVVGAGALAVAGLRSDVIHSGPMPFLAIERAQVSIEAVVASDPVRKEGQFTPYVLVRITVETVEGRGQLTELRSPILVVGDLSWLDLRLGERITASGRLAPAESPELAAVLKGDADPLVTEEAGWMWSGVGAVRAAIREAVRPVAMPQRSLIPALVDGDDAEIPTETADDFRTTGLTHLLAVSGSNLTLVLGFALLIARWVGVKGRWMAVVGVASVVFFVLLARPEPSVLRAAAMGLVGVAGLTVGGRGRGFRAMCVAVLCLVLLDPWLARSVGFLLSTLATAGILLLAPAWRDAMARWMPRLVAEALAVPMTAQLVCTPAIAAISGQVSVASVVSNVLVAPAVGPTTVLGLVAGLVALASRGVGHVIGWAAGPPAWWIVTVADRAASLDGAAYTWPAGPLAIGALVATCLVGVALMPVLLVRPYACVSLAFLMAAALAQPWGRIGWPPSGWLLVMCDVGQGDALVLNAGDGAAVVVDAGPDPAPVDRCLTDLGISTVALVVLTHFHADHVGGLPGVIDGREIGGIEVSPVAIPEAGAEAVARWADDADIPVMAAATGDSWEVGALAWTVLAPRTDASSARVGSDDEGSTANNASVVMSVAVGGHRFLLTGDAETEEEQSLLSAGAGLEAEVVKVSHHGSENQDPAFYAATNAVIALISVGADNDYGHPSSVTLGLLEEAGVEVYRTDLDGDVAVVDRHGVLEVVASRR